MQSDLSLLGERSLYPGHPVTLMYLMVATYTEPKEAWTLALEDLRIPGAGGSVGAACDLIKAVTEGLDLEKAFAAGDRLWEALTRDGYQTVRDPGQTQADRVKPLIRESRKWFGV